ncbi:MAG: MoaD/ThiS family protein [Candidatus Bathyarchaeota archaeon]|nr:MoaD/ThiS family protein [Candidatus Bathyarchaeum tardum]WGM88968.1 MAG: MoaD/ThiS family protein [Candidatus Bathyarchaeum tardum]WNZ28795.1 MAG: MoaD/ThiS family protein [Candidatus Bathyarchaeota archaeon]
MPIDVEVKFLGIYQRLAGKKSVQLKLDTPTTIRKAMKQLAEIFSEDFKRALIDDQLDDPKPNALIIVNGKEINVLQGLETEINHAEEIILIPMVHGG